MIRFARVQLAIAGFVACASVLGAQKDRPEACPSIPSVTPRSETQKREARKLAEQARQAAIVDGSNAAQDLFKQSVDLDPTDPNTVYALARSYDASKAMGAAIAEYCRFLSLTPGAPEASDVRRRITTLAEDVPKLHRDVAAGARDVGEPGSASSKSTQVAANGGKGIANPQTRARRTPTPNSANSASNAGAIPRENGGQAPSPKSPSDATLALAPFIPGLGQYATHRPFLGAIVTASSLGALYMGMRPEYKTVTTVPTNPRYQPTTKVTKERPNLGVGVTLAMGVSILAELEAYMHGRASDRQARPSRRSPVVMVMPDGNAVGVGVSVAFR